MPVSKKNLLVVLDFKQKRMLTKVLQVAVLVVLTNAVNAQATISGKVKGSKSNAVAGATVTCT
jgi:hypothetical protein